MTDEEKLEAIKHLIPKEGPRPLTPEEINRALMVYWKSPKTFKQTTEAEFKALIKERK